ncbi:hypothetical protein PMAYCL1PPCAC_05943, partial [Pristionchus mayeri]
HSEPNKQHNLSHHVPRCIHNPTLVGNACLWRTTLFYDWPFKTNCKLLQFDDLLLSCYNNIRAISSTDGDKFLCNCISGTLDLVNEKCSIARFYYMDFFLLNVNFAVFLRKFRQLWSGKTFFLKLIKFTLQYSFDIISLIIIALKLALYIIVYLKIVFYNVGSRGNMKTPISKSMKMSIFVSFLISMAEWPNSLF